MGYSAGVYINESDREKFRNASQKLGLCRGIDDGGTDQEWFDKYGNVWSGYSRSKDLIDAIRRSGINVGDEKDGDYADSFYVSVKSLLPMRYTAENLRAIREIRVAEQALWNDDEELSYEIVSDWLNGVTEHRNGFVEIPSTSSIEVPPLSLVIDKDKEYFHSDTLSETMAKRHDDADNAPEIRYDVRPTVTSNGFTARTRESVDSYRIEYDVTDPTKRNEAVSTLLEAVTDDEYTIGFSSTLYELVKSDVGVIATLENLGDIGAVCEEAGIDAVKFEGGW